jgi:hypothetical protein
MEEERKIISKAEVENEKYIFQNQITLGDITLVSFKPLRTCERTILKLLKNPLVKDYLQNFQAKKLMGSSPGYID